MSNTAEVREYVNSFLNRAKNDKSSFVFYVMMAIVSVVFVICLLITAVTVSTRRFLFIEKCPVHPTEPYRLSPYTVPLHYKLNLRPDLKTYRFTIDQEIALKITEKDTQCITMNQNGLTIDPSQVIIFQRKEEGDKQSYLYDPDRIYARVEDISYDTTIHRVTFHLSKSLRKEKQYIIVLKNVSGQIRKDLTGFYKSTYTDKHKKQHEVFLTQFESTYARQAFVCFDEPTFKTTYDLTITLPGGIYNSHVILANGAPKTTTKQPDKYEVEFERTPPMPTYLVAYFIGEYESVSSTIKLGGEEKLVSVYTPLYEKEKGQFAVEVASKVMEYMYDYFGFPEIFSSKKMDLLAIPDFQSGAMENTFLITFRASRLLLSSETSTTAQKRDIALVISHELSHHMNGDLVTCEWWKHLFLNEGFANFFEHYHIDATYPDYDVFKGYLPSVVHPAMMVDAMPSTHPIVNDATVQSEIESVFDAITYDKGSAVLRMFYHYLGDGKFKTWMRTYFSAHLGSTVVTSDLVDALVAVSGNENLRDGFYQWTNQSGFPVVSATYKKDTNSIQLKQKRFYSHEPIEGVTDHPTWWIPLTLWTAAEPSKVQHIEFSEPQGEIQLTSHTELFKLNAHSKGFYRVNYDSNTWEKFISTILHHKPSTTQLLLTEDRFGLIDDAFALGRSGALSIKIALEMSQALKNEQEYAIWQVIISNLYSIGNLIGDQPAYEYFSRFAVDTLKGIYENIGWDESPNEKMEIKLLRASVIRAMIHFDFAEAITEAENRFDNRKSKPIPTDLTLAVYEAMVAHRGENGFKAIKAIFDAPEVESDEKLRCAYALMAARRPSLIAKGLELVMTDAIRSQDGVYVIRQAAKNIYGADLTWNFVRERWSDMKFKFGERQVNNRLVIYVTSLFDSVSRYDEVQNFLRGHTNEIALQQALEQIRENIHFLDYSYVELEEWLVEKGFEHGPFGNAN